MSASTHFLNKRVLRLNVGDITGAGPGYSQEATLDLPALRVAADLALEYLRGPFRLSRTREGVLLQGQLQAGLSSDCDRCLTPTMAQLSLQLEELYSYPVTTSVEFSIGEDGILDLAPLLRAEVLIASEQGLLCKADCRGLCPDCGANRNQTDCNCDNEELDPRMAALRQLLEQAPSAAPGADREP